jgi:hypothetical protein
VSVLISLLIGLVFGCGLIVSGMSNPARVLAFLDLAGDWDPSLALVMAGAIAVGLPAFRVAGRRQTSLRGQPLQMPTARQIDRRLLDRQRAVRRRLGPGGNLPRAGARPARQRRGQGVGFRVSPCSRAWPCSPPSSACRARARRQSVPGK